ncbi:MAG: hypothetical protein AB1631_26370, partial [Acidobacteriota bacterium]
MTETLDLFDRVAEDAMPQDGFWPGYEKRLAARLAEARPAKVVRLWRLPLPATPLAVAASLLLVALSLVAWLALSNRSRESVTQPQAEVIDPPRVEDNQSPQQKPDSVKQEQKTAKNDSKKTVRKRIKPEVNSAPANDAAQIAFIDARAAEHIEQAELLLRSFRNARAAAGETAIDISFERRQARAMLDRNTALRREAEFIGHRNVEELLSTLEPFLLDIANLPDLASKDEIDALRSLLGESSIITDLQLHSLALMSRGL